MPIFDKYVVQLGILYRWLKRNGMDYAEEKYEYDMELRKKFGSGLATEDIRLDGEVLDLVNEGVIIDAKTAQ